jgi:hypothetical protein
MYVGLRLTPSQIKVPVCQASLDGFDKDSILALPLLFSPYPLKKTDDPIPELFNHKNPCNEACDEHLQRITAGSGIHISKNRTGQQEKAKAKQKYPFPHILIILHIYLHEAGCTIQICRLSPKWFLGFPIGATTSCREPSQRANPKLFETLRPRKDEMINDRDYDRF